MLVTTLTVWLVVFQILSVRCLRTSTSLSVLPLTTSTTVTMVKSPVILGFELIFISQVQMVV